MTDTVASDHKALAALTSELVAAYVAKNHVQPGELPALIASVHATFDSLGRALVAEPEKLTPSVPIRKSVTDEYIISLEDGRKFKSMKRYLGLLGMTPEDYRSKWGLPNDYPMVAPAYAAQRSTLAKTIGLGRKATSVEEAEPATPRERRKPGRPKKSS